MRERGPYKTRTISRLTGLSPVLLRAWERRHGLLEPERGSGGHRLYTEDDLAVLRQVQRLIDEGRSIGEIAALGRTALLAAGRAVPNTAVGTRSPNGLEPRRQDIVRAAVALDAAALNRILDSIAAAVSSEILIDDVIEPAAREIGDLWQAGKCSVAGEHLASSAFVHRLRKLIESAEPRPNQHLPLGLAACLPGEDHQLGLMIVSYYLNRNGVRVLYLGASLPFDDLRHACLATRPEAVLLSVTRKTTFRRHREGIPKLLDELDHRTLFYLGGLGAPRKDTRLEAAGLRLTPGFESATRAAERIAADLTALRESNRSS